jgi:hypothetical protein
MSDSMKAYKVCPKGKRATPQWIIDQSNSMTIALDEFKKTYGIGSAQPTETFRYYTMLANARLSIYRDKRRLNLNCNPLIDEFSTVFAEWLTKKPGFKKVEEKEAVAIEHEEFMFPY